MLSTCLFLDKVQLIVFFMSNRGANNSRLLSPLCPCYPKPTKYRNVPNLFYWNISKVNIILPYFPFNCLDCIFLISFLYFVFVQLITLVDNFARKFCISSTNTLLLWLLCSKNVFFAHDYSFQSILFYSSLCHLFLFPIYWFLFPSAFHLSLISLHISWLILH